MTLPVPSPRTWSVNDLVSAALLNTNIRDAVNFLANAPLFLGWQSAAQSIPNSVFTAVALDTNAVDTYNGHSTVTNNTRYTAQVAGWYECIGSFSFASNATGFRVGEIFKNGAVLSPEVQSNVAVPGAGTYAAQVDHLVFLAVGDFVEMRVDQGSGAALSLIAGHSALGVRWIHA